MNDLLLTETGDLLFLKNKKQNNKINISFNVTSLSGVKLSFYLNGCKDNIPLDSINIKFEVREDQINTYTAKIIKDIEAYRQACFIRIKTPLQQLPKRLEIGSYIETVSHDFLFEDTTIQSVINIVKESISDILPDASVTAIPIAKQTENGYKQIMNVKIYSEDLLILNYDLE